MAATRSASAKIDWTKLTQTMGLRGATLNNLTSFKARNDEARRRLMLLQQQPTEVDFGHYRSLLKNSAIIDDLEKAVREFQIKKIDVSRQIKAIEAFEATAVKSAEETKGVVEKELKDLDRTLGNIEGARPFEDLTVDEVMAAQPEIEKRVEKMVSNHRWMPPGYKEKFGDLSIL